MDKFNGLSLEAHRIASIPQIENLMALHSYYHAANMNSNELADIWSKEQPTKCLGNRILASGNPCPICLPITARDTGTRD